MPDGSAYYEDLAGRLYGLLITLEGRLDREQAQLLHHFINVGEYDLALEKIVVVLARTRSPLATKKGDDMLALGRRAAR